MKIIEKYKENKDSNLAEVIYKELLDSFFKDYEKNARENKDILATTGDIMVNNGKINYRVTELVKQKASDHNAKVEIETLDNSVIFHLTGLIDASQAAMYR